MFWGKRNSQRKSFKNESANYYIKSELQNNEIEVMVISTVEFEPTVWLNFFNNFKYFSVK